MQDQIETDLRFLILSCSKNRRGISQRCLSTLSCIPKGSRLIVIDDNSSPYEAINKQSFIDTLIYSITGIGANGTALCRLAIAYFASASYDYIYLVDSDIYHFPGFWQELDSFIKITKTDICSPAWWTEDLHRVVLKEGLRYDKSISGACLVIKSSLAKGCFFKLLTNYCWGSHGWDWTVSNYLCSQYDPVSPQCTLVQHLGHYGGIHPGVLCRTDKYNDIQAVKIADKMHKSHALIIESSDISENDFLSILNSELARNHKYILTDNIFYTASALKNGHQYVYLSCGVVAGN